MRDEGIEKAVRRQVGLASLRRLRRLLDAEAARQRTEARRARCLAWLLGAAAIFFVAWLALR